MTELQKNALQKTARSIQFTIKFFCFCIFMFVLYILNDVFDGALLQFFYALIITVIGFVVIGFVFFTKWEDLFENDK